MHEVIVSETKNGKTKKVGYCERGRPCFEVVDHRGVIVAAVRGAADGFQSLGYVAWNGEWIKVAFEVLEVYERPAAYYWHLAR